MKLLAVFAFLLLLAAMAFGADVYEYYAPASNDTTIMYGVYWYAQSFTVGTVGPNTSHDISSVKLRWYRTGTPSTITVSIRETDGDGEPTGLDLSTGTTNGSTLTTDENGEWREIAMSEYELAAGQQYAIVVRALLGNAANWIRGHDVWGSGSYAGGYYCSSSNSGVDWVHSATADFLFEVYGSGEAPNTAPELIFWKINGYDFNSGMPFFKKDANLAVIFAVKDAENNRLSLKDLNWSTEAARGSGTVAVSDLNLNGAICQPQDWTAGLSGCTWQVIPTAMLDQNYYLLGLLSDGTDTNFSKSQKTFGIDGTAPAVNAVSFSGYNVDSGYIWGTGTISAAISDARSGVVSCEYTLTGLTWLAGDFSLGLCSTSFSANHGVNYSFQFRGVDAAGNTGTGAISSYTGNKNMVDPGNVTEANLKQGALTGMYNIFKNLGFGFLAIALVLFCGAIVIIAIFGKKL